MNVCRTKGELWDRGDSPALRPKCVCPVQSCRNKAHVPKIELQEQSETHRGELREQQGAGSLQPRRVWYAGTLHNLHNLQLHLGSANTDENLWAGFSGHEGNPTDGFSPVVSDKANTIPACCAFGQ